MNIDNYLGPAAPELGWIPAPRYLLRRDRIKHLMQTIPKGKLLEIGPGAGALLVELVNTSYQCEAIESSPEAQKIIKNFTQKFNVSLPIHRSAEIVWAGKYDIVCAFEVLEHIENDQQALEQWCSWLKPGGTLLISVPAHMKKWNARDVWAGHFRRYEKEELVKVLESKNLKIETIECYGFPLANITEPIDALICHSKSVFRKTKDIQKHKKTELSGIDRKALLRYYPIMTKFVGKSAMWLFIQLQRLFIRTDWGNGYIVKATKA